MRSLQKLSDITPFLVSILLGIVLALALLHSDLPVGHDSDHHLFRTVAIADIWRSGYLIPRWASSLGGGYGYPVFIYAAWFPSAVSGLLHLGGVGTALASNLSLVLASMVLTTGSLVLGRKLGGAAGGWVFLGLYAFAPYQLVNLYVRYAAAEFWGGAFAPWLLWALLHGMRGRFPAAVLPAALLVAAMILAHGISTLVFLPLCLFLALLLSYGDEAVFPFHRRSLRTVPAFLLGLGTTAFFWMPLVLLRNEATLANVYSGRFAFGNHFLYPRQLFSTAWGFGRSLPGPDDGMSFQIGIVPLLAGAGLVFLLAGRPAILRVYRKRIGGLLALAALLFFCTTWLAEPLWNVFPPLRLVQLPWRLLLPGLFLLATAAALAAGHLELPSDRRLILGRGVAAAALFMILPYIGIKELKEYPAAEIQRRLTYRYETTTGMDEYRPVRADASLTSPTLKKRVVLLDGVPVPKIALPPPSGSGQFRLDVTTTGPATLTVPVFMFPGWRALVDGRAAEIATSPVGLVNVAIRNKGKHLVLVERTRLPAQRASLMVSLASSVILFGFGATALASRRRAA